MKPLKRVLLTGTLTILAIATMTITTKAVTVKITGEVLNVRKGPSTEEKVVAMLSEGVECELLGEEGDWYKIKYKSYTGYISKQYAKKLEETSDGNQNVQANQNTTNQTNQNITGQQNNQANSNTQTNQTTTSNNQNSQAGNNQTTQDNNQVTIIYKKLSQNADIKILPLIHASKIGEIKKNAQVVLLSQTANWSYIQTDTMSGWVRNDYLTERKTVTSNGNSSGQKEEDNTNNTQRTAYISEEGVNFRKKASTSSAVIKVLKLNTQVTVIGEEGNWCQIKVGNDTGYVSKDYVASSQKVTSRSSSNTREENQEREQEIVGNQSIQEESSKQTISSNQVSQTSTTSQQTGSSNSSIKGSDVVAYAKQYLGCKYVYGGDGRNKTFDCSGFTMYVYKHFGINLPHAASKQYKNVKGKKISKLSDLQLGDLVFLTDYETGVGIGHCGIYIGNGEFIDASTVTYTVTISSFKTMFKDRFYAGLRVI